MYTNEADEPDMSLKEKIISLIDKFGCIGDVNFNYLYEGEAYQSALQFAS